MTLSSTIRTLMGGTVPSRREADAGSGLAPFVAPRAPADFFFLGLWPGRGEDTRFGGVMDGLC